MQTDDTKGFDNAHLQAWWVATRQYLFADMESLPRVSHQTDDGWSPPDTGNHGGRKRFIARARGRLLRSLGREEHDDPLRELERAFQRQIAFIARHPEVPRRLLAWLRQDGDARLRRRIQAVIGQYAARLARIIGRARQQGLVRADIEPQSEAMRLVGLIQGLALGACRALGSDSENRPRRGQFSTISPGNSRPIAQEMGEKWAGAVGLQPEIPKPDRLLGIDPDAARRETLFKEAASAFACFQAGLLRPLEGTQVAEA